MITTDRPFFRESDQDMTLADLEAFCVRARRAGATDRDVLKVGKTWRGGLRRLALKINLAHNREAAYQKDHA